MRKLMAVVLCAVLVCIASATLAQETATRESNGFEYMVQEDGTVKILGFTGEVQEVTFPGRLNSYDVTAIGENVLKQSYWVTSVVIPESIVSISSKAFSEDYGMESIFVRPGNPKYESIGGVLYDKTEKRLHAYPKGRWSERYSIQQGTLEIGEDAFSGCYSLNTIELPESIKKIGGRAFADCFSLSEITLPDGIVSIGEEAFYGCEYLKEMTLPSSLSAIGNKAFANCPNLREFHMEGENPLYSLLDGVLYDEGGKRLLCYPGSRKGANFTVPEGTAIIAEEAFAGNRFLNSVVVPVSVESVGTAAFAGCTGLTGILVTEGNVTYHTEDGVLFDSSCKRLEAYPAGRNGAAYEIPEGTEAIGDKAFADCMTLENVTIPQSVASLGEAAFQSCQALTHVALPNRIEKVGSQAFAYCYMLESAALSAGIEEIGDQAFYASGLTEITLPEGLASIGENAFGYCTDLMGVYIPGSVTHIAKDAFSDCYQVILEFPLRSYALTFAYENEIPCTQHPVWLK